MRIFAVNADWDGCFYWRFHAPMSALKKYGGHDVVACFQGRGAEPAPEDILFIQHIITPELVAYTKSHIKRGGKFVYQIDDNIFVIPRDNPAERAYVHKGDLRWMNEWFLANADHVFSSTDQLTKEMSRRAKSISTAHNAIDEDDAVPLMELADSKPRDGNFWIGWAGSPTHVEDFRPIVPSLLKILDEFEGVRIGFIGADLSPLFPLRYRLGRVAFLGGYGGTGYTNPGCLGYWRLQANQGFSIAIAPILNTSFNASKSYIKLMEYGMLGVPAVASDFGPYREYVSLQKEEVCLLAKTPKEWYAQVKRLIQDEALRDKLRKNNRANVLSKHLTKQRWKEWETPLLAISNQTQLQPSASY
jgi:glycosyltransferase involved in cell wall biosynthesis